MRHFRLLNGCHAGLPCTCDNDFVIGLFNTRNLLKSEFSFFQGMADVMEIVNKFLNRDLENQKLKLLAEEAEKKLEVTSKDEKRKRKGSIMITQIRTLATSEDVLRCNRSLSHQF